MTDTPTHTALTDAADVIPPLGSPRPAATPPHATYRLTSGLVVSAVYQPATPMVHLRLRLAAARMPPAASVLLTQWMFRPDRIVDGLPFGERAADCGARFTATLDVDNIQVSAHCVGARLPETLRLLATVLDDSTLATSATEHDLTGAAHMMRMMKSRPGLRALESLNAAAYGEHPYATPSPDAAQIMSTTIDEVDDLRRTALRPDGATMAIVGDRDPAEVATLAESAFADWSGVSQHTTVPAMPETFTETTRWHHIPGAVRTSVRLAMRVPGRASASYAALKVANLVFGGYFPSRLNTELRERRGLCYSVRSAFAHTRAGSVILVSAEIDGQRTAEGLNALREVLSGMNDAPITADEHVHARCYGVGAQELARATQAELAEWAVELAQEGTDIDWLRRHALDLANVDLEAAREAAAHYLQPRDTAIGVAGEQGTETRDG